MFFSHLLRRVPVVVLADYIFAILLAVAVSLKRSAVKLKLHPIHP
jgi:hypothetical protein